MDRIKIEKPEHFEFSTEIPVRITDINYGNHLGNDSILSIIHEARVRFLNSFGFTELNAGGEGIIMVDSAIEYKAESFYGDVLIIEVTAGNFDRLGCDIFYRILNKKNSKEIALAKTGILFYDYTKKQISKIPKLFLDKVKK